MIADKVDTNNDGVISKEELMVWISHIARRFVVSYMLFMPSYCANVSGEMLLNFLKCFL